MPFTGERWPGCFCHYSYDAYLFAAHPKNSFPITGRLPTHTAGTESRSSILSYSKRLTGNSFLADEFEINQPILA
jgi:hypothetical protein